tara:strand:+ start:1598 stop:1792 length:195 start_codon:yes stop_codon:yes gene_type:complete
MNDDINIAKMKIGHVSFVDNISPIETLLIFSQIIFLDLKYLNPKTIVEMLNNSINVSWMKYLLK